MYGMTAIYSAPESGWIPDNDFSDRLAQIRSRMGWNYSEAGNACGLDGEAWARWELEGSRPQHFEAVCRTISTITKCDLVWLATGRSSSEVPPPQRMKRRDRRGARIVAHTPAGQRAIRLRHGISIDAQPLAAKADVLLPRLDSNQQPFDNLGFIRNRRRFARRIVDREAA